MNSLGGLLDRYVAGRFLGAYGMCLLGFIGLFLVVDLSSNVDDFMKAAPHFEEVGTSAFSAGLRFYASKLPTILMFVGPFLTLFAAITALLALSRHRELTPMVSAGRGLHRVLLPIYLAGGLLVFVLFGVENFLVPGASATHREIKLLLEGDHDAQGVDAFTNAGNNYEAEGWRSSEQMLLGVQCRKWIDPEGVLPEGSLLVKELAFGRFRDTGVVGWFPRSGTLRPFGLDAEGRPYQELELPYGRPLEVGFTPTEIDLLTARKETALSRGELERLIARYPENRHLQMDLHARWTRPLASLILLLLGLPFITRVGGVSITSGLGVALVVSVSYFVVTLFFQELGTRGDLKPFAASWIPPAVFAAIALARLTRIKS